MARVSREQRIKRAKTLIHEHPEWSRAKVNQALRSEFKIGLRYTTFGWLKAEAIRPGRIEHRYRVLIKEGFLPSEARNLCKYPISSAAMAHYRTERRRMVRESVKMGLPKSELRKHIRLTYRIEGHYAKGKIKVIDRLLEFAKKVPGIALKARPKPAMTLTQRECYRGWKKAGFLTWEARELVLGHAGVKVDARKVFDSVPGRKARRERREWVRMLRNRGFTMRQIVKELWKYYHRDPKRSPWDFIRKAYRPRRLVDFIEYRDMAKRKADQRVADLYRRRYPVRAR